MKKTFIFVLGLMLALSPGMSAFYAQAAVIDWASGMDNFAQGLQKGGAAVDTSRSNPSEALGPNDGVFVSLGFGGELTLEFPVKAAGILTLAAHEVTGGTYPLEKANVYVSDDGINFNFAGEATNEGGLGDGISAIEVGQCVKFVRLVDTTDPELHGMTADAYDVDAVSLEYDEVCPEEEPIQDEGDKDLKIKVKNYKSAYVMNMVHTSANTGNNTANGGAGGEAGDGGNVSDSDDMNTGGAGGAGGIGGDGGTIITGAATASATITNEVNTDETYIDPACGCATTSGNTSERVFVHNRDRAKVKNIVMTNALTGDNTVNGGDAAGAGNGGSVTGSEDDNIGGAGGVGGNAGWGGTITTGPSVSDTHVVNMVNRIINRIRF